MTRLLLKMLRPPEKKRVFTQLKNGDPGKYRAIT